MWLVIYLTCFFFLQSKKFSFEKNVGAHLLNELIISVNYVLYDTREGVFRQISKHREVS